jgi:hypothetical protein
VCVCSCLSVCLSVCICTNATPVAHRYTWRCFLRHSHSPTLYHPTETKKPRFMAPLSHVPAFFIFFNFYYYVIIVTPLSHILSFAFAHIAVSWAAPFFKSPAPPTLPGGPQSLGSRVHPGVGSVLWRRRLVRILLVLVTATAVRAGEREREEEGCVCGGGGERARARARERSSGTVFHKGCFLRAYEQVCAYGFGVERVSH